MVGIKAVEIDFNRFELLIAPIGLDVGGRTKLFLAKWAARILNEPVKHALLMEDVEAAQHSASVVVFDAF
jgi:hypothetical protein